LLQTPTTVQTDEPPEKMRARAEKNGYKNGTKFGSLTSQIKYDERVAMQLNIDMLPTPLTRDYKGGTTAIRKDTGKVRTDALDSCVKFMVENDMLPTPQTQGLKVCDENGKTQFIDLSLLPRPKDLLQTPVVMEDRRKIYGEKAEDEHRTEKMMSNLNPYSIEQGMGLENGEITAAKDGKTSRLSPLFTEEMMGFPLMWTALPFLSESGAPKPSKPTATR
jgi:hypothetical protein